MHLLRTWRITLVCFWESKSDYLLPTGKVPTPLCLTHRARASARPSPSCTLRSIFGPVKEKTTWLTRTHCQTTSDISPQQWGGRSQSTREPWTQETIVRRKDGGAVTCSVLIIFRGQRRLAAFLMLPWELIAQSSTQAPEWAGEGGKSWLLDFLPVGASHLQWLPLAGHTETVGVFCTYNMRV